MKRIVKLSVVSLLLLCVLGAAAMADATNWVFKIGTGTAPDCSIGWFNGYNDGKDPSEGAIPNLVGSADVLVLSNIPGTMTYSTIDYRKPYSQNPTLPKTWDIVIYTRGTWVPGQNIRLTFKPTSYTFPVSALPQGAYVKFTGVYNATFSAVDFGLKTDPWSITIPATDGSGQLLTSVNPAYLIMTVGVVPEPSSMFGLVAGLCTTGVMMLRRKKG